MAEGTAGDAQRPLNVNRYATKKTIAQGMLDIALLTANASQLKYVLQTGGKHPFYTLMISLISVSIILQVLSGVVLLILNVLRDCRLDQEKCHRYAIRASKFQIITSFLVTCVNVIIAVFDPAFVVPEIPGVSVPITVGISILYIGTLNINKEKHCTRANLLNNLITVQIFIISSVNVIISAFGIEQVNIYQAESARRLAAAPAHTQSLLQGNQTVMIFDEDRLRSV